MKKILSVLLLLVLLAPTSCDKNEVPDIPDDWGQGETQNPDAGAGNFDDVAVSGSCSNVGGTCATIAGYINIDKAPIPDTATNYYYGISYTDKENWEDDDLTSLPTNVITGRSISVRATDLRPNTTYYYHSYFKVIVGGTQKLFRGETYSFKTLDFVDAGSASCIDKTPTSATIELTLDKRLMIPQPEDSVKYRAGILWSQKASDLTVEDHYPRAVLYGDDRRAMTSTYTVSGLKTGDTWYYCSFTSLGGVEKFGEVKSFTVGSADGYVDTGDARDIGLTSVTVTCRERVSAMYPSSSVKFGVSYLFEDDELYDAGAVEAVSSNGEFTVVLDGLLSGTKYLYTAYAYVDGTYFYGEGKYFTTVSGTQFVKTGDAADITLTSATLYGSVVSPNDFADGSYSYGIAYYTSFGSLRYAASDNMEGSAFSVSLTNLKLDTEYTYYAYIQTEDGGHILGEPRKFVTKGDNGDLVKTLSADNSKAFVLTLHGSTTLNTMYADDVVEYGFRYGTSADSMNGKVVATNVSGSEFSQEISAESDATCYYRAYATVNYESFYGETLSISPKSIEFSKSEYVDLGLPSGTLWCTSNLGASSPEEVGDYYAWANIESANNYNHDRDYHNKEMGESVKGTKYDIAMSINSDYRTPSYNEAMELVENCTVRKYTYNDVSGVVVIGPNGNYMFLPSSGYEYMDNVNTIRKAAETNAYLWTAATPNTAQAYALVGYGFYGNRIDVVKEFRYMKMPVRAVLKK